LKFTPTKLAGAAVVEPEPHEHARGFFARTFCAREFGEHGLACNYVQCGISHPGTVCRRFYQTVLP
jgi:dTDP-4-dehydrorhamnose 3,5-epimerase